MLPLSDHNPRRTFPFVTLLIIAINVLLFFWELSLGPALDRAMVYVGFVPARLWAGQAIVTEIKRMFVSMFLHGGFLHIISNMLYLWIFGDNIEDRLGHVRYTIFYFACGVAAALTHAFMNPSSTVPAIGASGAIAGVLGAYIVLFPRASVTTVIPIFFFITVREIPAVVLLGLWIVLQLFVGIGSLGAVGAQNAGGVAYFAHIGGFAAGIILILLMGGRRPPRRAAALDGWR